MSALLQNRGLPMSAMEPARFLLDHMAVMEKSFIWNERTSLRRSWLTPLSMREGKESTEYSKPAMTISLA